MNKLLVSSFIIFIILAIMMFPLGIYILLSAKLYTGLIWYILIYIWTFRVVKTHMSKIDTIEIKIG